MIVESTIIPDVLLITPPRFLVDRGFFSETWNETRFAAAGVGGPFVQERYTKLAPGRLAVIRATNGDTRGFVDRLL
jgi:dTDP-4-dehydrorhamnose 3,5-epimerase